MNIKTVFVSIVSISLLILACGCTEDMIDQEVRYDVICVQEYHADGSFCNAGFDGYIVTYITNENMIKKMMMSSLGNVNCISIFHTNGESYLIIKTDKYSGHLYELHVNKSLVVELANKSL